MELNQQGLAVCLTSSFCGYHTHAGFLNELARQGLKPSRLAGASAGALVAGLWASGIRDAALESLLGSPRFKWAFFDWLAVFRFHLCLTGFGPSGGLTGKPMRKYLRRFLGEKQIEELQQPSLEIAVTNITKLTTQLRNHGPLADFIVASLAVPLIFATQTIEGEDYLDGGIVNDAPYEQWLDDPAIHTIIVHRIQHHEKTKRFPWRGIFRVSAEAHTCVARDLARRGKERAEQSGKKIVFVETKTQHPGVFQGRLAKELVASGAATAQELAASLGRV